MGKATLKLTHFMRTTELLNSHKVNRNSIALAKRRLNEECAGLGQVAHMCLAVLPNWKVPWVITYTLERPGKKKLHTEQTLCIWSRAGVLENSQGVSQVLSSFFCYHSFGLMGKFKQTSRRYFWETKGFFRTGWTNLRWPANVIGKPQRSGLLWKTNSDFISRPLVVTQEPPWPHQVR